MVIKPRHALFSWKGWRGLCFCVLPPAQNVFPSSRRGGACPSRRFLERPRPAHPRSRTLCHGWSEPGAAVKWHRPKFCTAPGPSGPEGMKSGTVFCAPELLRKGVGVSPVNGGPGEERLWAGTPIGAHPRRRFGSFFAAEKGTRPAGRNPQRRMKPIRKPAGGSETPLQRLRRTTAGGDRGRGKPIPYGLEGQASLSGGRANHSRTGWWAGLSTPGRRREGGEKAKQPETCIHRAGPWLFCSAM